MLGDAFDDPRVRPDGSVVVVGDEFNDGIDGETVFTIAVSAAVTNELLSAYFHSRTAGKLGWVVQAAMEIRHRSVGE
jgi:hypothetical protein